MSKYKSLDVRVPTSPNNMRATFKRLIHKSKPVNTQVLPRTKSFAGKSTTRWPFLEYKMTKFTENNFSFTFLKIICFSI